MRREQEKHKAHIKKMGTVTSPSNSPWRVSPRQGHVPNLRRIPLAKGTLPHPQQSLPLGGGPSKAPARLSPQGRLRLQALVTGWWAAGPPSLSYSQPLPPLDHWLPAETPTGTVSDPQSPSREALSTCLLSGGILSQVTHWGPEWPCVSLSITNTQEDQLCKRGNPPITPQGEPLLEITKDPSEDGRRIRAGLACPRPRSRPQSGSQTYNQAFGDTIDHLHPEMITNAHFSQVFTSSYCSFLFFKSELRKVGKLENI